MAVRRKDKPMRRTMHKEMVKNHQYTVEGIGRSVGGTPTQAVNKTAKRDKEQPGLGYFIKKLQERDEPKKKKKFDKRKGIDI